MDADTWSREKWSRTDDTTWRRIQRARRWLKIGSIACYVLAVVAGVYLILEARGIREEMLTDAARMRAEAAEIRLAVEYRRCESFPSECKLRQSVFYRRAKLQPEEQPTKRR